MPQGRTVSVRKYWWLPTEAFFHFKENVVSVGHINDISSCSVVTAKLLCTNVKDNFILRYASTAMHVTMNFPYRELQNDELSVFIIIVSIIFLFLSD